MYRIKNLSKTYLNKKVKALDNVNFEFNDTGLYYIVGESGSGKSTLLKIVGALDSNYSGSIKYFSTELKTMDEKTREDFLLHKVSLALQEDELDYNFSVRDNLLLALETYDLNLAIKEERIVKALSQVGLSRNIDTKLSLLSGGEVKRVNLARALIKDYEVLLLDEPLGPLDKNTRRRFMDLFENLSKDKLVIVISHNLNEIDVNKNNVINIKDGKLSVVNLTSKDNSKLRRTELRRKKYSLVSRITDIFKMFKRRMKHTLLSIFATSLALTSLGITSILTDGVSGALDSYFKDEIDEGSLVIKRKTTNYFDDGYRAISYLDAREIKDNYESYVYDIGTYYEGDYENLFSNCNRVFLKRYDKSLYFNDLSLRDFIEFTYMKESDECEYMDLENDEIVLGLTPNSIANFCDFLNIYFENNLETVNSYLGNNDISIYLELRNPSFKYELVTSFKIVRICETKVDKIIHSSCTFSEWLVEEQMEFLTSDNFGEKEVPWMFFKSHFLYVVASRRRDFLNLVRRDKRYDNLSFSIVKNSKNPDDVFMKNKVLVLRDYREKLYLSDVQNILLKYKNYIRNYYLFNSFYSYFDEGLQRVFLKPIYLSSKKELINELIDVNYSAKIDLEGFQEASIITSDEVVRGDVLNMTSDAGLKFVSYYEKELSKGYYPRKLDEIVISSGLAKSIFKNKPFFLDSYVHLASLKDTSFENGVYKNNFVEAKLKVTGVIENDDLVIYQSEDFISALGEDQFGFNKEDLRVDKVLVNFKDSVNLKDICESLKNEYNAYDFSLPSLTLSEGINEILNYVKVGLFSFSVLTGVISLALITFVVYLFIKRDENKIRLMFLEGYTKKDVVSYYLTLSLTIGFISFLETVLTLIIINFAFIYNVENLLGVNLDILNLKPFLLVFISSIIFSTLANIFIKRKFKDVDLSTQFID